MRLLALPQDEADPAGDVTARHVVDLGDRSRSAVSSAPLARWSAAVASSHDPCLVVDPAGRVVSVSAAAAGLLGCLDGGIVGRVLLEVVEVIDLETGAAGPDYAARIAPLAVLHSDAGLARSLLRVRAPDGGRRTVDASAAPIHDMSGRTIGSICFLARVGC